jgi:hypothetical protein
VGRLGRDVLAHAKEGEVEGRLPVPDTCNERVNSHVLSCK